MKIIQPSVEILTPVDGEHILKFIELCGRTCYKSESNITFKSAWALVKSLIKHGHESVLEHFNITVKVVCSRAISHQIVRHRIAAYSQESQRYVSYDDDIEIIYQPALKRNFEAEKIWTYAIKKSTQQYQNLIEMGVSPEVARDVLPNATATRIVITYNLRQWRHFLKQRTSKYADPQIRLIALMILDQFQNRIPVIFDDIEKEGYGNE